MSMVRYKKSTGNIRVTADKRIKYEVIDILTAMDICIIESIIHTRDNVVIEGDNRALTLIIGLKYNNINLNIDYDDFDCSSINEEELDRQVLGVVIEYKEYVNNNKITNDCAFNNQKILKNFLDYLNGEKIKRQI